MFFLVASGWAQETGVVAPAPVIAIPRTVPAIGYVESYRPIAEYPGTSDRHDGQRLWNASVLALAAANAVDSHSSWGKRELNPALRGANGTFGANSVMVKAGIMGGLVAFERFVLRRNPRLYRGAALINFSIAAGYGAVATRNYRQ
jgi:hypothetical protein